MSAGLPVQRAQQCRKAVGSRNFVQQRRILCDADNLVVDPDQQPVVRSNLFGQAEQEDHPDQPG